MKKIIECPFYKRNKRKKLHCEGGVIKFHNKDSCEEYREKYCSNNSCWKKCTVAASLIQYYSGGNNNE